MSKYRLDVLQAIGEINRIWWKPTAQCYLVALLLASRFNGEIWYNSSHCITLIGGVYYDRSGIVRQQDIEDMELKFLKLDEFGINIKNALIEALIYKHKNDYV